MRVQAGPHNRAPQNKTNLYWKKNKETGEIIPARIRKPRQKVQIKNISSEFYNINNSSCSNNNDQPIKINDLIDLNSNNLFKKTLICGPYYLLN
jgi:hypothetical protein